MSNTTVIRNLKARYFDLCKREVIGKTPKLTAEIDRLEEAIWKLQLGDLP